MDQQEGSEEIKDKKKKDEEKRATIFAGLNKEGAAENSREKRKLRWTCGARVMAKRERKRKGRHTR